MATDAISDLLLVSEPAGEVNLRREGIPDSRVRYVGNVMIDTLVHHLSSAGESGFVSNGIPYALLTLHRPSNVDSPGVLASIVDFLIEIAGSLKVVFPVHPRTRNRLENFGLIDRLEKHPAINVLPPLSYTDNLALMRKAAVVLTDSGGIQEETSYLSVPCLTLRDNTERPVTVSHGTNTLVGLDFAKVRRLITAILDRRYKESKPVPGWDGRASHRVVNELCSFLETRGALSRHGSSLLTTSLT